MAADFLAMGMGRSALSRSRTYTSPAVVPCQIRSSRERNLNKQIRWLASAVITVGLAMLAANGEAALNSAQFDFIRQQEAQGANITMTGKVWIKGDKIRVEMKDPFMGEQLWISDGKDLYLLSPQQKAGQKRPLPVTKGKRISILAQITGDVNELRSKGKKVGRETVEGVPCDVYIRSAAEQGTSESIKAWIAMVQDTPLPIKVVMKRSMSRPGAQMAQTHTFTIRNLKTNISVADAQFAVPKGYKLGTAPGGGGLPGVPPPGQHP
jgi:outer membrane lipoprotein-sorting protein